MRIDDYDRAVGSGQDAEDFALRHYPSTFRGYNSRLAALLGLEYLVLDRPLTELPRDIPRPKAEAIYTSDSMYIYKLGKAVPRATFAPAVVPVDNEEVLDEHVLPAFDPASEVLIDQASMAGLHGGPYAQGTGQERFQTASHAGQELDQSVSLAHAAIVNYSDNLVEIDADAPTAGIVVLHDIFYPGWEARVDGNKEPVLRANILFRGVEVPAGHHRVRFLFTRCR